MKKLLFTTAIILSCLSVQLASAQLHVSVGVNIGSQPAWGPVGYDHADYYYMPDIDAYYSVPTHRYIYLENNIWVHRTYLPARYSYYDPYHSYKVVVNERNPWERNNVYRTRYAGYRGRHDQVVIRDSRDDKYRNHWNGGNRKHDNGNHYGQGGQGNPGRGNGGGDRGHGNGGGDRGHGNGGGGKGHGGGHGHGH